MNENIQNLLARSESSVWGNRVEAFDSLVKLINDKLALNMLKSRSLYPKLLDSISKRLVDTHFKVSCSAMTCLQSFL